SCRQRALQHAHANASKRSGLRRSCGNGGKPDLWRNLSVAADSATARLAARSRPTRARVVVARARVHFLDAAAGVIPQITAAPARGRVACILLATSNI